jgi:hypothetical protein
MVTHKSADWPLWIFWTGLALAVLALIDYAVKAKREAFA